MTIHVKLHSPMIQIIGKLSVNHQVNYHIVSAQKYGPSHVKIPIPNIPFVMLTYLCTTAQKTTTLQHPHLKKTGNKLIGSVSQLHRFFPRVH